MEEDLYSRSSGESGWTKYIISSSNYTSRGECFCSSAVVDAEAEAEEKEGRRKKINGGYYKCKHDHTTTSKGGSCSEDLDSMTSDASSGPSYDAVLHVFKKDDDDDDEQEDPANNNNNKLTISSSSSGKKKATSSSSRQLMNETRKQGSRSRVIKGTGYHVKRRS